MSKSLLITNDFPPIVSGISTAFYNLFRNVENKDFVVLAPKVKGSEVFDEGQPFQIIRRRIPLGEGLSIKILKTIISILLLLYYSKRLNVKRIHCGQVLSNGIGGWLCKTLFSIPYVMWVYGSETVRLGRNRLIRKVLKGILGKAECVVVNSEFTKEEYLKFGVDEEKLVKINPGVDTSFFKPMEKEKTIIEGFGLEDKKVILTVSRLDERKGHDKVIEALPEVISAVKDLRYLIVGKGREEERLKNLADKMGLNEYVVFAGYVPDEELPLYYNLCDIFVLPNRITEQTSLRGDYEGFGIVFLEASSCGKPVIGGKTGGVSDAVVHGETGLLVDPLSAEEIALAIVDLLQNERKAAEYGRNGRQRAVKGFDWKVLSKKLEKIL